MLGASMSEISIDFDKTFVVQMLIFAALIVVLKPLLFDPVLKVFEEREKRTDGARAEARRMQEEAGLGRYESELEKIHRVAGEERDHLRSETAKLEAEILAEARAVAGRIVEEGSESSKERSKLPFADSGGSRTGLADFLLASWVGRCWSRPRSSCRRSWRSLAGSWDQSPWPRPPAPRHGGAERGKPVACAHGKVDGHGEASPGGSHGADHGPGPINWYYGLLAETGN
ncbi:MAG: ATP synthase F0 subunit B [Polyangiaceae bacterium]